MSVVINCNFDRNVDPTTIICSSNPFKSEYIIKGDILFRNGKKQGRIISHHPSGFTVKVESDNRYINGQTIVFKYQ